MKKLNKNKLFFTVGYFLCIFVLIFESCLNGNLSAFQSNALGNGIAGIVNGVSGDQTTKVKLEKINITNKISVSFLNDIYKVDVSFYPDNATDKSLIYNSSDDSVATISTNGMITFLNIGEVTFNVSSKSDPTIFDTFSLTVKHIEIEEVEFNLNGNKLEEVNTIYLNKSYILSANYFPSNATNNKISYDVDKPNFLKINNVGNITPLSYSNNEIITISVTTGNITKKFYFIVSIENYVALERIEPVLSLYEIYVSESKVINFNFYPNNATFKNVKMASNNDNIKINNSSIKGIKSGSSTIIVSSIYDSNIYCSIDVNILVQEDISTFDVKNTFISLNVGSSKSIGIEIIRPNIYASLNSLSFTSENDSIAKVNKNGVVTGVSAGTTNIIIKSKDCTKSVEVVVKNYIGSDTTTTNIKIDLLENFLYTETFYDLNKIVKVKFFSSSNEYTPADTCLSFYLDNNPIDKINVKTSGIHLLRINHLTSGISKEVEIIFVNKLNINNVTLSNPISLLGDTNYEFEILNDSHEYIISLIDSDLGILKNNGSSYSFTAYKSEGIAHISIIPTYDNHPINSLELFILFSIYQNKILSINYDVVDLFDNSIIPCSNDIININMNQSPYINLYIDEDVTIYDFHFESLDDSIISVSNIGVLNLNKAGKCIVVIKDIVSGLEKELIVNVFNIIKLDENSPLIIDSKNIIFSDNIYHLLNGHSAKINLNFTSDSTFTTVKYSSSNDDVVSVGDDGVLIPHKMGDVLLEMTIDDGFNEKITISINLKVDGQKLISDLGSFLFKIRKGIGHFGAFFVFGIFSSLVFLVFFNIKNKFFSVFICFLQGFSVASITEIIQLFVPGRSGLFSDVILDFTGFCISCVFILIIFLINKLIKKYKY